MFVSINIWSRSSRWMSPDPAGWRHQVRICDRDQWLGLFNKGVNYEKECTYPERRYYGEGTPPDLVEMCSGWSLYRAHKETVWSGPYVQRSCHPADMKWINSKKARRSDLRRTGFAWPASNLDFKSATSMYPIGFRPLSRTLVMSGLIVNEMVWEVTDGIWEKSRS